MNWLRGFSEWQTIQPSQGAWNWKSTDALVADARANNIHLAALFAFLAPWASADGSTRKFPIKNMQYWRDYVTGVVTRYHNDIEYWEVWNEFDGSFAINGTPKIYADLVRDAYDMAKKIDPTAKIGMSVANFDVGFLDAAIKAGAADHFDYIAVHPYEILGAVADHGEVDFLSMAGSLRLMLAANHQWTGIPLWITEIGAPAPILPDAKADLLQAEALAKAYLLSIASGFQRIFWFEARGPAYGKGTDLGLIRADWTPRPSYEALKTIASVLGRQPRYLGWLDLDHGGYGFLFHGQGGNVLAAWSPANEQHIVKFAADVHVVALANKEAALKAGQELTLTGTPALLTKVPAALVEQAQGNAGEPFPWGGDYSHAEAVTCQLQATNIDDGVKQIKPQTTVPVVVDGMPSRRTDFTRPDGEGHYVYFRVDPQFAPFGSSNLKITAVVRRVEPGKAAGLNLQYESLKGYAEAPPWYTIPADDQWHELTWKVTDANFVGAWGYNFRLSTISSPNELYVKEVQVRKLTSP
ncbi:MAG: endo-1,4-beta-xylanase [Pseudomonadota bacterium]|nr:endo-1,4-beta-xylanase [Pseudomonadota bacterium]